jgi:hypothetical protein
VDLLIWAQIKQFARRYQPALHQPTPSAGSTAIEVLEASEYNRVMALFQG